MRHPQPAVHLTSKLNLAVLILLSLYSITVTASSKDSLDVNFGMTSTIATRRFQPLWIVSNRFGVLSNEQVDLSSSLRVSNKHRLDLFGKHHHSNDSTEAIDFRYNLAVFNNQQFRKVFFAEANILLRFKNVELKMGRYKEVTGEVDPMLSSGSLGISGNSLPIPKIEFGTHRYVNLPLTNGLFQFKASMSHGWMGEDRAMKDAYLHQKSFYARLNLKGVKLFGGVQHFGEWGGHHGDLILDRSIKGFFDVLLVREANDGSLDIELNPNKRPNRAGDQRGLLEFGADFYGSKTNLRIYNQTPFESGKGIDIRNIDRLVGGTLSFKEKRNPISKIVLEFIYTKQMESFGSTERQSYYNNGVYATGWEYKQRIIGTPLFINRTTGSEFLDIEPFDWDSDLDVKSNKNIVNNRILGFHTGLSYRISKNIAARSLITFTVNHGSYANEVIRTPHKQLYSLQELNFRLKPDLSLNVALAFDTGELYTNLGSSLGLTYNIFKRVKNRLGSYD